MHDSSEQVGFKWGPGSVICIIGGRGEMGRLFARFFEDKGYRVLISDVDASPGAEELIAASDVVLFSVPLHETVGIIRQLLPYTRPEQLLMDLTSLKSPAVEEMLRSEASVVGLHPMFGGRISTFSGQTVVACPVRIGPAQWAPILELFTSSGVRVKETTPAEHDRMMSIIQVLFHLTTMLTGRVLRELGTDIPETMEYMSPSYRLEIGLLGRMFAQSPILYSAISQMNPHTSEIVNELRRGLDDYAEWLSSEDLEAFIRDFRKSAEHLGDFCAGAFRESSEILAFSTMLANGETKSA